MRNFLPFLLCFIVTACGGSGGGMPPSESPPANMLSVEGELLANRIGRDAVLDNGAYDWRQEISDNNNDGVADLPDTSVTGYQNVTGVTALGPLEAYLCAPGEVDYGIAELSRVKDYLIALMRDYIDGVESSVSLPNFVFVSRYRDGIGLSDSEWATTNHAFARLLLERDQDFGDVSGVISDGIWNRIYDARSGIPGIRGWDLAWLYKALFAMNSASFNLETELDWVALQLAALPLLPSEAYGPESVVHVLEVCAMHGLYQLCLDHEIALQSLIELDGSIGGSTVATAYGVLALKEIGDSCAAQIAYLTGLIGSAGEIGTVGEYEYFEAGGEVLMALIAAAK